MPELPEVEVLVRYWGPRLRGRTILECAVMRRRMVWGESVDAVATRLRGRFIREVWRRGKYILFEVGEPGGVRSCRFWLHLGMTGRLWWRRQRLPLLRHTSLVWRLDRGEMVLVDPRGFGRCGFDPEPLDRLGPEPLGGGFTVALLATALAGSRQALKQRLMDQRVVAGLGNIYASEALWEAGLSPARPAGSLTRAECVRLVRAIRKVLRRAIGFGSSMDLDWSGEGGDRLFYFGRASGDRSGPAEFFAVYDREGLPCGRCGAPVRRVVQGGRSTYYCGTCQT